MNYGMSDNRNYVSDVAVYLSCLCNRFKKWHI